MKFMGAMWFVGVIAVLVSLHIVIVIIVECIYSHLL